MKVETTWLMRNYMIVKSEMDRSSDDLETILSDLAYNEEEKAKLRWVFSK